MPLFVFANTYETTEVTLSEEVEPPVDDEIVYNIFELIWRGDRMDYMTELAAIAREHGGMIETKSSISL